MIREAIENLVNREGLSYREASESMKEIMSGEATPSQIAGFLTALRMKGETVEEIMAFA
ncbi:MAG: anthranilate phosphoribosyltransferase, partial [Candidatus Bathyarchaeia archaeon]